MATTKTTTTTQRQRQALHHAVAEQLGTADAASPLSGGGGEDSDDPDGKPRRRRRATQAPETAIQLPMTGFVRLPQILSIFPIGRSSWWRGISEGRYPKGVKLSEKVTAWRVEDIRELIANAGN